MWMKLCTSNYVSNDGNTYPALGVLVWMVLLRQSEVRFPDFTLLVSVEENANFY